MKKKIAAAFLISAALLSAPVFAADSSADAAFNLKLTEEAPAAGAAIDAAAAFLESKSYGEGLRYAAYPLEAAGLPADARFPYGQIRLDEGGLIFTADVINFSVPVQSAPAEFQTLFGENGRADIWGKLCLATANEIFANAQSLVNQKIVELIAEWRERTGDPIPYSLARVDFRSMDPIHRMDFKRTVYTAGTRILVTFDGWKLPLYVKAYLYQEGNAYRIIGIMASDSQKGAAMLGGDAILADLVK